MQLHATIAFFTVPEIALEQDEAHDLALALAEVEKHYPINPLTEKHMAVLGLFLTVSKTYGKRVPIILNPSSRKATTRQAPTPATPQATPVADAAEMPPDVATWFALNGKPPQDHFN